MAKPIAVTIILMGLFGQGCSSVEFKSYEQSTSILSQSYDSSAIIRQPAIKQQPTINQQMVLNHNSKRADRIALFLYVVGIAVGYEAATD